VSTANKSTTNNKKANLDMKIQGAVALITGANGGIGLEFIKALQTAGVTKIYACVRKVATLAEVISRNPEQIIPIKLDITNLAEVNEVAAYCQDVNLLINNAGVSRDTGLIAAPDMENARAEMETNYFGTLTMCRTFAPVLKANGGGAIINILSIVSRVNLPFMGSYCASKAAELSLTQGVRAELAAQGTLVIGVMPATVNTEFAKHYPEPKLPPEEVVQAALHAVLEEIQDVYPGQFAAQIAAQLLSEPKAVENQLAGLLPEMYPFA
jgi:NAD(P)-dependent dehydrogenase (short-subunit alcohol dehydrogenase family)